MSNGYLTLKTKHQNEVNAFPMVFAFNRKQLEEGMAKLGLTLADTDKVYKLPGTGGIFRKTDSNALHEMLDRHCREMDEAIKQDITGEGFIFEMFKYELANHEYSYTRDTEDTLEALGLTLEEVTANPCLHHGLKLACKAQLKGDM